MADKNLTLKDFAGKTTVYRGGKKAKEAGYQKAQMTTFSPQNLSVPQVNMGAILNAVNQGRS